MKFEKLLLSFFAILGGLIVAGVAFYLYQSTKAIPSDKLKTVQVSPPTPTSPPVALSIDTPQNESVTDNKIVPISGHTDPQATLVISTDTTDQVITPTSTGGFSTTVTIGNDENQIHILAIDTHGQEAEKTITVTYSTENF